MKKIIFLSFISMMCLMPLESFTAGGPPNPGGPPLFSTPPLGGGGWAPLGGGTLWLVSLAAGYGLKKYVAFRKNMKDEDL